MLLSLGKNGLTSLFKEVRVFKVSAEPYISGKEGGKNSQKQGIPGKRQENDENFRAEVDEKVSKQVNSHWSQKHLQSVNSLNVGNLPYAAETLETEIT